MADTHHVVISLEEVEVKGKGIGRDWIIGYGIYTDFKASMKDLPVKVGPNSKRAVYQKSIDKAADLSSGTLRVETLGSAIEEDPVYNDRGEFAGKLNFDFKVKRCETLNKTFTLTATVVAQGGDKPAQATVTATFRVRATPINLTLEECCPQLFLKLKELIQLHFEMVRDNLTLLDQIRLLLGASNLALAVYSRVNRENGQLNAWQLAWGGGSAIKPISAVSARVLAHPRMGGVRTYFVRKLLGHQGALTLTARQKVWLKARGKVLFWAALADYTIKMGLQLWTISQMADVFDTLMSLDHRLRKSFMVAESRLAHMANEFEKLQKMYDHLSKLKLETFSPEKCKATIEELEHRIKAAKEMKASHHDPYHKEMTKKFKSVDKAIRSLIGPR